VSHIYEKLIQGLLDKGYESVDQCLSKNEFDGLRKSLLKRYENDRFHLAGIGSKESFQKIEKIRNDQVHWLKKDDINDFETAFFRYIDGFVDYLNRTCFAGIREYEFHYSVYEQGSFYKKHIDRFRDDDRRSFSIVLYLTEDWQKGDGGELIIYPGIGMFEVAPVSGRLVVFSSDLPHEVMPSNTLRLALTGWLKTL